MHFTGKNNLHLSNINFVVIIVGFHVDDYKAETVFLCVVAQFKTFFLFVSQNAVL